MANGTIDRRLTDAAVKAAKPPAEGGVLVLKDGKVPGLVLRVSDRGGRVFACWYRVRGSRAKGLWTVGRVEEGMTLAEAREAAEAVLREARKGIDPKHALAARQEAERQAKAASVTVGELLQRFVTSRAKGEQPLAPASAKEYQRCVDTYVTGDPIGSRPAGDLLRIEAREYLDRLARERGPGIARSLHRLVRSAYRWGTELELLAEDRMAGVRIARARPRARVLTDAELTTYWKALDAAPMLVAAVLRLQAVTATRFPSELLSAKWRDVDLSARRWNIPAEVRKGRKGLLLPLSGVAVRLFQAVQDETGKEDRVFGTLEKRSQVDGWFYKAEAAVRAACGMDDFTPHDLRRTVADGIVRLGFASWPVADAILGHGPKGTAAVYMHAAPLVDMGAALERWGRHVERLVGYDERGADVFPMVRA
jgi:integrase